MSERVLVVEDEVVVAEDLKECLEEAGYEVIGPVRTAEDAIEKAFSQHPDLILMDIKLAGSLDGIDAAEAILREKSLPIVYLTAFSDTKTLERAKITEPFGYLLKPYKEVDLRTTIEIALYKFRVDHKETAVQPQKKYKKAPVRSERGSTDHKNICTFLNQVAPLKGIDEAELSELALYCYQSSYPANECITFEGDELKAGFVVMEGRVAILKSSASGKDLIVELLPPGDPFGLLCSIETGPYPYTTRSQIETKMLWVPREELLRTLDTHPDIARRFIRDIFDRLRNSHDISRSLAHDKVEVRVAAALLALTPQYANQNGNAEGIIPLTRQELADLTGTTQETCIRVTRKMENEGLLDLSKHCEIRVVDKEKLEDLAGI